MIKCDICGKPIYNFNALIRWEIIQGTVMNFKVVHKGKCDRATRGENIDCSICLDTYETYEDIEKRLKSLEEQWTKENLNIEFISCKNMCGLFEKIQYLKIVQDNYRLKGDVR